MSLCDMFRPLAHVKRTTHVIYVSVKICPRLYAVTLLKQPSGIFLHLCIEAPCLSSGTGLHGSITAPFVGLAQKRQCMLALFHQRRPRRPLRLRSLLSHRPHRRRPLRRSPLRSGSPRPALATGSASSCSSGRASSSTSARRQQPSSASRVSSASCCSSSPPPQMPSREARRLLVCVAAVEQCQLSHLCSFGSSNSSSRIFIQRHGQVSTAVQAVAVPAAESSASTVGRGGRGCALSGARVSASCPM